jgi:hypothetical protein
MLIKIDPTNGHAEVTYYSGDPGKFVWDLAGAENFYWYLVADGKLLSFVSAPGGFGWE